MGIPEHPKQLHEKELLDTTPYDLLCLNQSNRMLLFTILEMKLVFDDHFRDRGAGVGIGVRVVQ